jgi:hypothetical protein
LASSLWTRNSASFSLQLGWGKILLNHNHSSQETPMNAFKFFPRRPALAKALGLGDAPKKPPQARLIGQPLVDDTLWVLTSSEPA